MLDREPNVDELFEPKNDPIAEAFLKMNKHHIHMEDYEPIEIIEKDFLDNIIFNLEND